MLTLTSVNLQQLDLAEKICKGLGWDAPKIFAKKTARMVCSEAFWAEMSATGGKVGTGARLQFFGFFLWKIYRHCVWMQVRHEELDFRIFFTSLFKICWSGMYLQVHNMQVTNKQQLELQQPNMEEKHCQRHNGTEG